MKWKSGHEGPSVAALAMFSQLSAANAHCVQLGEGLFTSLSTSVLSAILCQVEEMKKINEYLIQY